MRNNNGFTLIELLATMVILGIIMAIAVPNVMGILTNSRNNTYVEDAKRLVSLAEYKFRGSSTIQKPQSGEQILLTLQYLDNSEFEQAPNGGEYDKNRSYVLIENIGGSYSYYVQLVEKIDEDSERGIILSPSGYLVDYKPKDLIRTENFCSEGRTVGNGTEHFIDCDSAGQRSLVKIY